MNKIIIILLSIFLTGCASTDIKDIEVVKNEKEIKIDFIHPNKIASPTFENINFKIINKDNYKELFKEDEIVYISLTTEEYKKLSRNMQEIIRLIKEQNNVILYYRENVD